MMQARDVQSGDVLEFPETGMMMVRDAEPVPATEEARISHVRLKCAVGRTDEGFELILPGFLTVNVYRSEGTVEEVGT